MRIDIVQLDFISDYVKEMANEIETHFNIKLTITSLYRPGDGGVHGQIPLRGIDFSCPDEKLGTVICDFINRTYKYDPDRPEMVCCMIHDAGSGMHIHLQCHPNTTIIV